MREDKERLVIKQTYSVKKRKNKKDRRKRERDRRTEEREMNGEEIAKLKQLCFSVMET